MFSSWTHASSLVDVDLLGRKKGNPQPESDVDATSDAVEVTEVAQPGTAPKGRPTPKRDAARKRGPVAPAPLTSAEARKRRKELKASRPKLSKEERKAEKLERRADMADRREKMMSGEDAYLLPRDKGPVRRFVRDVVDSRRNLLGLFMPVALGMIFLMLSVGSVPSQQSVVMQLISSWGLMALLLIMLVDGFILGRRVNKLVDAKFPENTESGWKLGFYAASRASQIRRMRAPRPAVNRGDKVT
jgi:hypothetical protein